MKVLLSCIYFVCFLATGQNIHINDSLVHNSEVGDIYNVKKSNILIKTLGLFEENIINLRQENHSFYIEILDSNLYPIKRINIPLSYDKKKMILNSIMLLNDKVIVLSSFVNQKLKTNYLFKLSIDLIQKVYMNDLTKIDQIVYGKQKHTGEFHHALSRDSSTILVYKRLQFVKNAPEQYSFSVFDKQFNTIWKGPTDLMIDYPYRISNIDVSNNGDVHFIGTNSSLFQKTKEKEWGKPHIISFTEKGKKIKDYTLDFEDKRINQIRISAQNDVLICAGFYSTSHKKASNGIFYVEIAPQIQAMTVARFTPFPTEFLKTNQSPRIHKRSSRKKNRENIELHDYDLRHLIIRTDNTLQLIAEQYYIETNRGIDLFEDNFSTRSTYEYNYNNIIVISINSVGAIDWTNQVCKQQHSINDYGYYSSFAVGLSNGNIQTLYNQNPKSYYSTDQFKTLTGSEKRLNYLILHQFSSLGGDKKSVLIKNNKRTGKFRVKVSKQLSDKSYILYCKGNVKEQFIRLHLK